MNPSEKRTALIRLLAHIDQQIPECESLVSHPLIDADERNYAAAQLKFRRETAKRVEEMLENLA